MRTRKLGTHRYGANLGVNLGLTIVSGGQHSDKSLGISGSIHQSRHLENHTLLHKEIIHLLLKGKSNKEIEDELFISIHTVRNHIYNIYKKFGIKNRVELVNFVRNFLNPPAKGIL